MKQKTSNKPNFEYDIYLSSTYLLFYLQGILILHGKKK